jgi:hypothetical protein
MSRLKDKYGDIIGKTYKFRPPIGIIEIWTIVFITLKLTGVIDWSWWWVIAPYWITLLFISVVFGSVVAFLTLKWLWERK